MKKIQKLKNDINAEKNKYIYYTFFNSNFL